MKNFFIIFIFIFLTSCSSNKNVYWCGDHQCINNKEKESYFKKTMIVEIKEIPESDKDKSEFEKIKKQAILNQKQIIKEEKELAKQLRIEEKRRIKEEKELAKQIRIEEKRRIKEEKKLSKKKILKENSKESSKKTNEKISISSDVAKIDVDSNTFKVISESIYKKNMLKPYPDINNLPN